MTDICANAFISVTRSDNFSIRMAKVVNCAIILYFASVFYRGLFDRKLLPPSNYLVV